MSKQRLSNQEYGETLTHLVVACSSAFNVKELTPKTLAEGYSFIMGVFSDKSFPSLPKTRKFAFEAYEKIKSYIMRKWSSVSWQIFFCDFCVYALKLRLKKMNSLTLPVIRGRLMKNHPEELNLSKKASGVRDIIAYQKEELNDILKTEEGKLRFLKAVKGKETDKLKSLFFKKRGVLKASLVEKGRKNVACLLRCYELFTLKMPSKKGRRLQSQKEVANALVEEGLCDTSSQQSVSRWNDLVKNELQALGE